MSTVLEELLPPEVRARRGQWSAWRVAPAVTASDIRRWAIAVYWPDPPPARFVEAEAAESSRLGGLVAPQELNPFAWLPGGPPRTPSLPGVRRLFGGCRIDFGVPIRAGDVVRSRTRLERWTPKTGTTGPMLVVEHTHEWRNQRDETVRDATYTLILRPPTDAAA